MHIWSLSTSIHFIRKKMKLNFALISLKLFHIYLIDVFLYNERTSSKLLMEMMLIANSVKSAALMDEETCSTVRAPRPVPTRLGAVVRR